MNEEHKGERVAPSRVAPKTKQKKKNNKILYYALLVVLLAVLIFSAVKIISYLNQQRLSEKQQDAIIDEFIQPVNNGSGGSGGDDNWGMSTNPGEPQPEQIRVNFDKLIEKYPDVVGYIYGANTGISYPVVQGADNQYYLEHDYDGNTTQNGSIFMEYMCRSDFGSSNSIIYGHHMKSGLMFAALEKYKSQSYYDAHPYFYIYTPMQNYRMDIFAGCVVEGDADIYDLAPSAETIADMVAKSTFKSKIGTPTGNIVTLSTCDYTYGYSDPRYVVLGQLVPIE